MRYVATNVLEEYRNKDPKKKKTKYSCDELYTMSTVDVYKLLIDRKIARFPIGFWDDNENLNRARECTEYLITHLLKWEKEEIPSKIRVRIFIEYRLGGMLQKVFSNSPYECINNLYPLQFKQWEFHETPSRFWKCKENRKMALEWVLEEKFKGDEELFKEKISFEYLKENGFGGLLDIMGNSPYNVVEEVYPGKYKEWNFPKIFVGRNKWKDDSFLKEALVWLYKELKIVDIEDARKKLHHATLRKYHLTALSAKVFKGSLKNLIEFSDTIDGIYSN